MSESSEWSKNNTLGWLPDTPTDLVFRDEPWEGQIGYNNIGQVVQYQNGIWQLHK